MGRQATTAAAASSMGKRYSGSLLPGFRCARKCRLQTSQIIPAGDEAQHEMEKQCAFEALTLQLPAPGEKASGHDRHSGDGCHQQIVVSHLRQHALLGPLRDEVEHDADQAQRDREVDQHDMLRMPGEQEPTWDRRGSRSSTSLHHDFGRHLGMNASRSSCKCPALVKV